MITNPLGTSYVMRGILCVTLDGKILGRWVFVVYVTRWWLVLLKEWVEGRGKGGGEGLVLLKEWVCQRYWALR